MKYILTLVLFQIIILESYTQSIDLYNENGEATAYIDTSDPDRTIYSWEGKPLAYLSATGDHYDIYGFNGKHLGWFEEGRLRDHEGKVWGFRKGAVDNVYLQYKTTKGYKQYKPYKTYLEEPPYKPYYQNEWTALPLNSRLYLGKAKDGTAYDNSGYNNQEGYGTSQKMNIYEPKSFDPGHVEYQPTMEIGQLDFSGLNTYGNALLAQQEQKLTRIENEKKEWTRRFQNARSQQEIDNLKSGFAAWRQKTLADLKYMGGETSKKEKEPEFLFGESSVSESKGITTIHFPDFSYDSQENLEVIKVQITRKDIILTIRYANTGSSWINLKEKAFIYDTDQVEGILDPRKIYDKVKFLKSVKGIAISPQKTRLTKADQAHTFQLTFPKLRRKTKMIDFIECESKTCFNIYNINIDPKSYE